MARRKHRKVHKFLVPINQRLGNGKTITCEMRFINSFGFMQSSLSILVDNLSEGLYNDKCTDCKSCLKHISTENELLIFKSLKSSKNHKKHFNKD